MGTGMAIGIGTDKGDDTAIDRLVRKFDGVLLLIGRLAIAALYVPSGFGKLTNLGGFAASLGAKGLPVPMAWAIVAAVIEFFGSLAIAVGFKTRYAALLLCAFTIAAALLAHAFWNIHDASRANQYLHFMKDMAIAGGLLFLASRGAGPLSIDRR
jgi:putative oxidoreductase